jgi:hypothetical protein
MGSCTSSIHIQELRTEMKGLQKHIDTLQRENHLLYRETVELRMRIENYGMIFSGNPCRVSPPSWEISRRLGIRTV